MLTRFGTKFDWGESPQPIDNAKKYSLSRHDTKIAKRNEIGASKRRVGLVLARWFGWAGIIITAAPHYAHAIQARDQTEHYARANTDSFWECEFGSSPSSFTTYASNGGRVGVGAVTTDSGQDIGSASWTFASNTAHADADGQYPIRDTQQYCWICTFDSSADRYTAVTEPTPAHLATAGSNCANGPAPTPTTTNTPLPLPVRVTFSPSFPLFILLVGLGAISSFFGWRNRNKSQKTQ